MDLEISPDLKRKKNENYQPSIFPTHFQIYSNTLNLVLA